MCNKPILLVLILILKVLILSSLPIYIIKEKKKKDKIIKTLTVINSIFIILVVLLTAFNNPCFVNSTIKGVVNSFNLSKYKDETINISNDPDVVEKIVTNKIYKTNNNRNVYYFDNYELPLSDKKVYCDDKAFYLKNYGNNITAMSILLSSSIDRNIDPIEIYNFAVSNNLFNCENGVDTDRLINLIAQNYNLRVIYISKDSLSNYISNGNIVLAKINNNSSTRNISCDKSNIIIYNINNESKFNILNPGDRNFDYICPDNTSGYGTVIKANSNDLSWTLDELNALSEEYISLERN